MRCFAECFISVFQHRIKDLFIKFKVVYDLSDVIAEYEVVGNDRPTAFKTKSRQAECSKVHQDLAQP